jgi:hypothetical protein
MDTNTGNAPPPLRRSQRFAKRIDSTKPVAASQDWQHEQPPTSVQERPTCYFLAPQNTTLEPAAVLEPEGFADANLQCGLWSLLPDEVRQRASSRFIVGFSRQPLSLLSAFSPGGTNTSFIAYWPRAACGEHSQPLHNSPARYARNVLHLLSSFEFHRSHR